MQGPLRGCYNRPFSYSAKEPGSSVFIYIFIIEVRSSGVRAYHYCAHSKIPQTVAKYRSIEILFRIAKRSIKDSANQIIFHLPIPETLFHIFIKIHHISPAYTRDPIPHLYGLPYSFFWGESGDWANICKN